MVYISYEKWLRDLSFLCGINDYINNLNDKLQGKLELISNVLGLLELL